ncbi:right-handed parallel beta-helix repeat-containing protein [Proteiniphilum sp. X52]|uniref:right-handed parallel beta-helix repeat-containing protein n=1 Tax=Proteiniphilum sp. X52 TaxID=2382159 RepID=UPI000F09C99C|nr:right-handed parallel beta-helix repeat-containing protein [Proteiniphilum sp. X52]RNC64407.1 hypothetical protein D7D25_11905 [Proteiniphilum sp. X52]
MKKQYKRILPATVILLLVAGCAEEMMNVPTAKETVGKQITIHAGMSGDTGTRVAYDDVSLKLTWEADDQLLVVGFDDSGNYKGQSTFTYTGIPGKTSGPFTGTAISGAVKYKVYYPATITVDEETGAVTYPSMSNQEQEADGYAAHLKEVVVLENTEVTDLAVAIRLTMMSSIVKFDLTNVPAQVGTLKKLEWKVETDTGIKTVSMNFASGAVMFSLSENSLTAYMGFLPAEIPNLKAGGTSAVILVGDKTYKGGFISTAGKTYTAGQRYTAALSDGWLEEVGSHEAGDVIVYDQLGALKNYYSCTADNIRCDTIINKALREVVQLGRGTVYLKGPFTFLIGDTVKIGDNTHLRGDSDVKVQPHDGANWAEYIPLIGNMSDFNQNIEISGFQLYGNESGVVTPPKLDRYYLCIILNGSNISIHNMHLSGNYGDGILIGRNSPAFNENIQIYNNTINRIQHDAVSVNKGKNVQVYNNRITSRLNCGIRMYNTNIVEVYDNYITSNNEGGAGIQIQKWGNISMDQINIHDNEIYKPKTHGIWIFGAGSYGSSVAKISVHHNRIYNTGQHGIISDGFDATVENNVIDGAGYSGIIQANVYSYPPPETLTFVLTAKNNIISNNRYYGIRNNLSETHSFSISYNCFFNNTEGDTYNIELPASNIIADPQFADRTNHDFHLKSQYGRWNGTAWITDQLTSPCIDAGDPADNYSTEPTPNGNRINIGVYGNTDEASKSAN